MYRRTFPAARAELDEVQSTSLARNAGNKAIHRGLGWIAEKHEGMKLDNKNYPGAGVFSQL